MQEFLTVMNQFGELLLTRSVVGHIGDRCHESLGVVVCIRELRVFTPNVDT